MPITNKATSVVNAILEDTPRHNKISDDRIHQNSTDSMVLSKVKYMGAIDHNDNVDEVRYGKAKPAATQLREYGSTIKDYVDGSMSAHDQSTSKSGLINTLVNDESDRSCDDTPTTIKTAMGFEILGSINLEDEFQSEVFCAKELLRQGKRHIRKAHMSAIETITDHKIWNLKQNLLQQVVKRGGANSSILAPHMGSSIFSEGRFIAPPVGTISWAFLREYRQGFVRTGALDASKGVLTLQGPKQDAIDAVLYDKKLQYGAAFVQSPEVYKDEVGIMKGREYIEYDQIRIYFNEYPRKFYAKQVGVNNWEYREIFPWVNSSEKTTAGVKEEDNPDYWKTEIVVDGQRCPVLIGMDMIHEEAMCRYGLNPGMNYEDTPVGNEMQITVRTGADLSHLPGGNSFYDKWQYVYRVDTRLVLKRTEWMGTILYLSTTPPSYLRTPNRNCEPSFLDSSLSPVEFERTSGKDCGPCGTQDQEVGDLVNPLLTPSPTVEVYYEGEGSEMALSVRLSDVPSIDGTVDYEITDETASFGTHYTHTPEGADSARKTGTLSFEAGCDPTIKIPIDLLASDPAGGLTFKVNLTDASGGLELGSEMIETTVCILDNSEDCEEEASGEGAEEATPVNG